MESTINRKKKGQAKKKNSILNVEVSCNYTQISGMMVALVLALVSVIGELVVVLALWLVSE